MTRHVGQSETRRDWRAAGFGIAGASNQQWRGYRIKENFASIYFALERADLVKRRMIAHRLRDKLPDDLPIANLGRRH